VTPWSRRLLAILVLVVVAALPAVAYSEPIDPTWRGGFWEDDDFDYLVLLVTHFEAPVPTGVVVVVATMVAIGLVPLAPSDAPVTARPLPFHRRGPPLA
jgi:hypothetical protein